MDNKITAQDIASYGRNGDTMLVHMTPDEVGGLQALAMAQGGSLTINPDTGLPEASFLSDTFKAIAPTLIGAGLTYFSGGTISPWMAGAMVGGVEAARTKDLGRGLLAGLGAYGGAGMGEALAGMGAAPTSTTYGLQPGGGEGLKLIPEATGEFTSTAIGEGSKGVFSGPAVDYSLGAQTGSPFTGIQNAGNNVFGLKNLSAQSGTGIQGINSQVNPFIPQKGSSGLEAVRSNADLYSFNPPDSTGFKSMGYEFGTKGPQGVVETVDYSFSRPDTKALIDKGIDPRPELGQLSENYKAPGNLIPETGTSTYSVATPPSQFSRGISALGEEGGLKEFGNRYVRAMEGPSIGEEALWSGKTGTIAAGLGTAGNIAYRAGAFDQPALNVATPEGTSSTYAGPYKPSERTYRQPTEEEILASRGKEFTYFTPSNPIPGYEPYTAARGGLLAMNKMNNGGLLKGPGDGVSDSIPAVIQGTNQPVMLSDGEYIIPAEVVSAVGDGSSEAGGRVFTKFVNTVMANTRKHTKGKENGAEEMLKGLVPTA